MIGWIIGAIGTVYVANKISEKNREIEYLNYQNNVLKVTILNHRNLLKDYDYINKYAKKAGFKGAVDLFYYLSNNHDQRFSHFARFLNKVRHIRNDIAHNRAIYQIDNLFLSKLETCRNITEYFQQLPSGQRLQIG